MTTQGAAWHITQMWLHTRLLHRTRSRLWVGPSPLLPYQQWTDNSQEAMERCCRSGAEGGDFKGRHSITGWNGKSNVTMMNMQTRLPFLFSCENVLRAPDSPSLAAIGHPVHPCHCSDGSFFRSSLCILGLGLCTPLQYLMGWGMRFWRDSTPFVFRCVWVIHQLTGVGGWMGGRLWLWLWFWVWFWVCNILYI